MTGIGGDSGGGEVGEVSETLKQPQQQPQTQQEPQTQQQPQEQQQQQQQQTKATNTSSENNNNNNRYWMRDLYKYSYPRGYGGASGLYNLAWAQAVQNKPLNDVLVELETKDSHVDDNDKVKEEDSEKEEGELEEGEIDGEDMEEDDNGDNNNDSKDDTNKKKGNNNNKVEQMETEDGELEIQVSSIRKVLDNVTVSETHKSFDIVCARLRNSLESLRELVLHTWFPSKDDLIKQSFSALLCVNSVFSSMSSALRDHNRDKMSRLLTFVMSLSSVLFTPDQRKEVEAMITSVTPPPPPQPVMPKPKARDRQEELPVTDNKAILTDSNTMSVNAGDNSSDFARGVGSDSAVRQSDKQSSNTLFGAMKPFQSNLNVRVGGFGPLLDPHKVHDEDSLPSPTSKTTPALPSFESAAPPRVVHSLHNSVMHPYETEALKAISSYQQKFGRSSFLTQDRLPSPTPSEDGNDGGADDLSEEISSSTTYSNNNVKNANLSLVTQPTLSSAFATSIPAVQTSAVATSIPVGQTLVSSVSTGHSSVGINPVSRVAAKSRDPRLRHLSSKGSVDLSFCSSPLLPGSTPKLEPLADIMNPKKKPEGPSMDSPEPKRQKNGLENAYMSTNVSDIRTVPGNTGSDTTSILAPLANRGFVGPTTDPRKSVGGTFSSSGISSTNPIAPVSTVSQPVTNVSTTDPLQSLLKGFSGNPAAWISMFKEQQKLSEPVQKVSNSASSNSARMQASLPTSAPSISSGLGQASAGLAQALSQSPQKDPVKPRMKPRDPRRALQTTAAHKTGNHASDQQKLNGVHVGTNKGVQENCSSQVPGNDSNPSPASGGGPELPDIAKQFTKNLKNIADIVTGPVTSSVSVPVNVDRTSVVSGGPESIGDQRALRPGEVVAGCSQSQNQWGDVEHLFEGYDPQQIAAIQQERARRMDEQKKMFDSRKLCLVLDLDHTLLNSAKFAEVDPRHDEILRKKEEHDREQPLRHLFRFPHMAMWTKLRPGIWTFLEKASKLYELHLYTMGNKLYATEMAKVLDPKGSLFSGRVISRGDDGEPLDGDDRAPKSKDLEGVLGMESAVVIIDDSVRVWPHNKLNLIVVERYLYFPCSRRHFGLSGPSLLDCDRDERPEDGTLACCLGVVEKIHQNFFANKSLDDLDVRNILASEQRKVLGGCRILFSRVFPVGEANPHLYPLWQTAEQFGAVCTNQIDEQVTHVVANAPGTDKVNWALSTGRFAVYPSWVEASAVLYRRASEQDFAIKP